ncbi:MAG: ABC transporter permease [Acidobacteriales bacterium 59-55]|nr:ABC transporter permease [Terriglobales bacterium]OJV40174.1 MAG: ABC transporter permease [Acidobacteriales bacterium 59-55]
MSWRRFFRRGQADADIQREMESYVEEETAENVARGMEPDEARRRARVKLGNAQRVRETAWRQNSMGILESAWGDLRYATRLLRRTPGFTVTAVLVMALGIGATVALFTVVHSVVMKPLPFRNSGRLMDIAETDTHSAMPEHNFVASADFFDWQKQARGFEQMALYGETIYSLSGSAGQLPEQVDAQETSWNLFPTLGVEAVFGRLFTASDDNAEANGTVVITWGLWKRRYSGDPSVVGRTILLNSKPYTVIGVLPAWFAYPNAKAQLWTAVRHEETKTWFTRSHGAHNFQVVGRIAPGVSPAQSQAELSAIQARIRQQFPVGPISDAAVLTPLLESEVGKIKPALYVLFAATGCLLLIACLNIANLLVARAASRRKESAIRTALGGNRWRLIREQVMESLLLSLAGGGLGLVLAWGVVEWLVKVRTDLPRVSSIQLDGAAILFGLGAMTLCGLIAGLVPALSLDDRQMLNTLQDASRSHAGSRDKVRLRRALLTAEVALTMILLTSAGLLLKSYQRLRAVNLGCATHNVLTMKLGLSEARYGTPTERLAFFEQLLDRVRAMPGVEAAGLDTTLPGTGHQRDDAFTLKEAPPPATGTYLGATVRIVDPGFFQTMQIPLIRGRFFQNKERLNNANVAIVTPAFAHKFFPNSDPIGKHVDDGNFDGPHVFEIVGVVGDTRETLAGQMQPTIYYPLYRGSNGFAYLVIRGRGDVEDFALPAQKIIASMDPDLAVGDILTMEQILGKASLDANFNATLLVFFALLSLVLAGVGIFGVLSYLVAQRTQEIGIRMALGAQRDRVLGHVLLDGLKPALIGLMLGLVGSVVAGRLIRSMLYATRPLDPIVFVLVSVVLLTVAGAACMAPAWRASRLDPMQALRTE